MQSGNDFEKLENASSEINQKISTNRRKIIFAMIVWEDM